MQLDFSLAGNMFAPLVHAFKIIAVGVIAFVLAVVLIFFLVGCVTRLVNRLRKKV